MVCFTLQIDPPFKTVSQVLQDHQGADGVYHHCCSTQGGEVRATVLEREGEGGRRGCIVVVSSVLCGLVSATNTFPVEAL